MDRRRSDLYFIVGVVAVIVLADWKARGTNTWLVPTILVGACVVWWLFVKDRKVNEALRDLAEVDRLCDEESRFDDALALVRRVEPSIAVLAPFDQVRVCLQRSVCQLMLGDPSAALEALEAAGRRLPMLFEQDRSYITVALWRRRGMPLMLAGRYDEAEEAFVQAEAHLRNHSTDQYWVLLETAYLLHQRSALACMTERWDDAERATEQLAAAIIESKLGLGGPERKAWAGALLDAAVAAAELGDHEGAATHLARATEAIHQSATPDLYGFLSLTRLAVARRSGDLDAAHELVETVEGHAAAMGLAHHFAFTDEELGHLHRVSGNVDVARTHLTGSRDRWAELGNANKADELQSYLDELGLPAEPID